MSISERIQWHANPAHIGTIEKLASVLPEPQAIIPYALVRWDDFQPVALWYRLADLAPLDTQPRQQNLWEAQG